MAENKRQPEWAGKHYSFFRNQECEFFPCHKTDDPDNFNCLFCYCPLYALKDKCGGNFTYMEKVQISRLMIDLFNGSLV